MKLRWTAAAGLAALAISVAIFCTSSATAAPGDPSPGTSPAGAPASKAASPELPDGLLGWPIGRNLPEKLAGKAPPPPVAGAPPKPDDILIWVPPGAKRIRSALVIPNNTDSIGFGACIPLRKVAAKHEMGVVYMRNFDTGIEWERKTPPDTTRMPDLMRFVAQESGVAEFAHAPWITYGKSSRGSFPFRAAWMFPERTIATISFHGETPSWPVPDWAKLKGQTIIEVNANGETEWGGTWFNHVRPSLLNYRAQKGWLAHQVVSKGVGHGDYPDETSGKNDPTPRMRRARVWEYLAMFVDKALELRVPKDKYPTDGPVELKQVDEAGGYLIDPFAVEELFHVPHLPLREEGGAYVTNPGDTVPVTGYAAMTPPKDFAPLEGVPVVKLEVGKSPREWILTESLKFLMKTDPITEPGEFQKLMPKPGDQVAIDDKTVTFKPIAPGQVGKNGGIAMTRGKNTLLAYTVIDVPAKTFVKVSAGFTAATRVQMVLAGVPVRHKQVLELQPGRYPMLIVVRMGVYWDRIEPQLAEVSEAEVAQARQVQADADKQAAEEAKIKAAGQQAPKVLIHKAADVPKEQRAKMFWVADKEQADAWLDLHASPLK